MVLKASATHPASRVQQLSSATLVEHTHAHTSLSLLHARRRTAVQEAALQAAILKELFEAGGDKQSHRAVFVL